MRIGWIAVGVLGLAWCALTAAEPHRAAKAPAVRRTAPVAARRRPNTDESLGVQAKALLAANCVACHGEKVQQGGLRLDRRAGLLAKLGSGQFALVPAHPEQSALIAAIRYDGRIKMPPKGKLQPGARETLARWVAAGAPWPAEGSGAGKAAAPAGAEVPAANYLAFQPLRLPKAPRVTHAQWSRTPVDPFILAALEQRQLTPTAPADRRTLIRRVTLDLTGLPPTPEAIEKFVQDPDPQAYEKLVDGLLASPHFGERWGRHWLDLARYADSEGQEGDDDRPTAYHYRDFVIRALNDDLPYNTFVRWQLAGDEIAPDNPQAVAATGFLVAAPRALLGDKFLEEERLREHYNDLDDIVSTTGTAFLGMTMGCARCHDHKYDPIPTRDYYRLAAAFNSGDRAEMPLIPRAEVPARRKAEQEWQARMEAAKRAKDAAAMATLERSRPPAIPTAFGMEDFDAKPRESWLLERGDFRRRKEKVELGFLSVLCKGRTPADYLAEARAHGAREDTTYQRAAIADWITDTDHGAGALLARVIVNRLWQQHFGEGIVRTVSDFGKRCEAPTHPELLEWLAAELVRGGWKLKPLHRLIVLSAAYRQDTTVNPQAAKIDPENRLLWHRKLRRIEADVFRDSMLAVAGTLNPEMYGSGFKPPIQREAIQARNVQNPYPVDARDTPETRRRTIYMFHKRVVQYPLLQAFDAPDGSASCARRNVTTVAPQALAVLNEPFIRLRALEFAARLEKEAGDDPAAQVQRAYRLALGRAPTATELAASVRFLQRQSAAHAAREPGVDAKLLARVDFAQVVFGLNEFLYVD